MRFKTTLMTEKEMLNALRRISFQIVEQSEDISNVILLGIRTRGVPLAGQIADFIRQNEGVDIPVGELDISFYRDDLSRISENPVVRSADIVPDVAGKHVILVDDVLYTGRTVRAAMDAVMDHGRAATIRLAILIDRGHRELPVKANFVGKNVPTSTHEFVRVQIKDIDDCNSVDLYDRQEC
ncbi:MAG: bifunctional pyr operon transcriptional regulator/uracil phosphoribosyltransferase PyrR [Firmicutes bacterium]|nr:bifunctional pyr operon transcriptional regulator/uracil phosphoribosyltransferase PyrR [Bacillota bacterium]